MGESLANTVAQQYLRLSRARDDRSLGPGEALALKCLEAARRLSETLPLLGLLGRGHSSAAAFHGATVGRKLAAAPDSADNRQLRAQLAALKRGDAGMPRSWTHPRPRHHGHAAAYPLAAPEAPTTTFEAVVMERRSCRAFEARPLAHAQLSTLLQLGAGRAGANLERVYPSGGGLYPIDLFVAGEVAVAPARSLQGVLVYDAREHRLLDVTTEAARASELPRGLWNADMAESLYGSLDQVAGATLLFLVARLDVSRGKYGDFGYVLTLLEAGHMAQALCLAATALGLAATPMGYGNFTCTGLPQLLGIDGVQQTLVHTVAVGYRSMPSSPTHTSAQSTSIGTSQGSAESITPASSSSANSSLVNRSTEAIAHRMHSGLTKLKHSSMLCTLNQPHCENPMQ